MKRPPRLPSFTRPARRGPIAAYAVLIFTICGLAATLGFTLAVQFSSVTTEVRVNARRLESGRIEFALQQRDGSGWGERIETGSRYFTINPGHSRWVVSSPFTIELIQDSFDLGEEMMSDDGSAPVGSDTWRTSTVVTSDKPALHPIEVEHDLGDYSPGASMHTEWETWHYFSIRGNLHDAMIACRDGAGSIYGWFEGDWNQDEIKALRQAQVSPDWIGSYFKEAVETNCNAEINRLSLFPEWEPTRRDPTLVDLTYAPPGDGSRWLVNYTMFGSTDDPYWDHTALMFGCLPGSNLPGVKVWMETRQDGGGYAKPHSTSTAQASFPSGERHTFSHGEEWIILTGDAARAFLGHAQTQPRVTFEIPMGDHTVLATFHLFGVDANDSIVKELYSLCYSQSQGGGVGSGSEPDAPGYGSATVRDGSRGPYSVNLHVGCNWTDWAVSLWVTSHGSAPRFHFSVSWEETLDGRTYVFDADGQEAELHDEEAREFWRAAQRAGSVTMRIPGMGARTFDVSGVDSAKWGCK